MIARNRHSEETKDGKPIYIIKTYLKTTGKNGEDILTNELNQEYNGTKYNIIFRNGVGRTTSQLKAQMLSEQFGYVVSVNKKVDKWSEAKEGTLANVLSFDEDTSEDDLYVDDGDEEEVAEE